ncbi:MAG TPA: YeeE/YedE family protein [Polyangiaceae bacterium]|nr:YeeE/YedE family protein [Polyangiaceae bacterium]
MQASFWYALVGGALIGLSASLLLLGSGRVAGISGVLGGVLLPKRGDRAWRALFLIGLLGAGALSLALFPEAIGSSPAGPGLLAVAGLLVGVGTRIGSGCTSGHGVCGVARLSQRSVVATAVFVAVGMLTTGVVRALGGL